MIQNISSRQNERIKEIVKLSQKSYKDEKKLFIIEGFHLLEMALNEGLLDSVYSLSIINEIPDDIPQYIVTKEVMEKISKNKSSQGVLALCKMKTENKITSNHVLYLDDISDPGNLGTLLRSALAFKYKDVILSKNCCYLYNEKVVQASQGAIFKLNILVRDFSILNDLKNKGYLLLVTSLKKAVDINEISDKEKHVIVLGNEAHGVSDKIMNIADKLIKIKINDIDSLNVSIAGAIAMYVLGK